MIRIITIILFVIFFNSSLFSQNTNVDSLVLAIVYDHDTVLIDQLYDHANKIIRNDWESSEAILTRAKILSQKNTYIAGEVKWYLLHGKHQRYNRKYNEMDAYGDSAFALSEKHNYPMGMGEALSLKGRVANFTGEYREGLQILEKALPIFKELDEKRDQMIILGNMAIMHDNLGDLPEAINKYLQSLKIAEELQDSTIMAILAGNIGITHRTLENYGKALEYFNQELNISIALDNYRSIPKAYGRIGTVFKNQQMLDSASWYFNEQMNLSIKHDVKVEEASALLNLGSLAFRKEQFHEALKYYKKSLTLKEQINASRKSKITSLTNIALCHSYLGSYQKSNAINQQIIQNGQDMANLDVILSGYRNLITNYKLAQDYKKAFEYNQLYDQYKDSLISETKITVIEEFEKKYETAEKEIQIAQQKLELQKKESILQEQQSQLILSLGTILIIILTGGFLFYRNKQKQKISIEQTRADEQQKGFKAVITATEEERKRIAKDLHDGVVQQLGAINLSLAHVIPNLSEEQASEVQKAQKMTEAAAEETRNLSHQMMPKVLIEMGLVSAMKDVLEPLSLSNIIVTFENFELTDRYQNSVEIAIYRIFQELINNIVKHSGASKVEVQLYQNGNKLILIVEDNGKGITSKSSSGIGMNNIKSRLSTLDGKVDYASGTESGTVATVVIPT